MDSKLRKHSVDADDGASVAHLKRLLANMSLVPAGFVPKLVYQQRMLSDDECIGSIGYSPERSISLVCVRSAPASSAAGPELRYSQQTEPNLSGTAAAQQALAFTAADTAFSAAADENADAALSASRAVIFSMGFDEALVRHALAQTGGDEQAATEILISGQLHLDQSPALISPRDACVPVIFSMGFDDALVRRALASAGGDEQRAVELILSGSVSSSSPDHYPSALPDAIAATVPPSAITMSGGGMSCPQGHACFPCTYNKGHTCDLGDDPLYSAACQQRLQAGEQGFRCDACDFDVCLTCCKAVTATAHIDALVQAPPIDSNTSAAAPSINFATEWLDEHGRVCAKAVDYATQCPKGHALAHFAQGGGHAPAQRLMCRVCHAFEERERASQWLVCSVTECCAGYAVCNCCASAVQQAPAAVAAGQGFSTLVTHSVTEAASFLSLCIDCCRVFRWSTCGGCMRHSARRLAA